MCALRSHTTARGDRVRADISSKCKEEEYRGFSQLEKELYVIGDALILSTYVIYQANGARYRGNVRASPRED